MVFKKIAVATCLVGLTVAHVQASVVAYDKVSGEPTLSVVSATSLQSATADVAETVSDLEIEVAELESDLESIEETISSDSDSDSDSDLGVWKLQGTSSVGDSTTTNSKSYSSNTYLYDYNIKYMVGDACDLEVSQNYYYYTSSKYYFYMCK